MRLWLNRQNATVTVAHSLAPWGLTVAGPSRAVAGSQPVAPSQPATRRRRTVARSHGATATGAWYVRDGVATRGRRIVAYLLLTGVMVAVAAMSWSGLFGFFTGRMHWSHGHALLGPTALDVAALVAAGFALDRIEKGETGLQFRLISFVLVGLSAFINWREALITGDITQELFFPAMSIVVYWLVHAVMEAIRRDVGREQHGQKAKARPEPLTRYDLLAWLMFPWKTWCALRSQIKGRLPETVAVAPSQPVATARRLAVAPSQPAPATADPPAVAATVAPSQPVATAEETPPVAPSQPSLAGLSQTDAIRRTVAAFGRDDVATVVAYLRSHGYPGVNTRRVNECLKRDDNRRTLRLVGEETG